LWGVLLHGWHPLTRLTAIHVAGAQAQLVAGVALQEEIDFWLGSVSGAVPPVLRGQGWVVHRVEGKGDDLMHRASAPAGWHCLTGVQTARSLWLANTCTLQATAGIAAVAAHNLAWCSCSLATVVSKLDPHCC